MSERARARAIKKYLEDEELTERQRETIQRFDKHKWDLRHWKSHETRLSFAKSLNDLGKYIQKPYEDMTQDDIINFLDSKNIAETTRTSYIYKFRTFFKWLYKLPDDKYPPCVSELKPGSTEAEITKSHLVTIEEMKKLITCAPQNYRDPAVPPVLQESMFRPGEFLSMNVGDVEERDYGFLISCRKSKTVLRSVPLIWSARYLGEWLNHHPYRDDPDAPLWISLSPRNFGERLTVGGLNMLIHRIARRAGIKKRIYSYLFRHTGATWLATHKRNEAIMRILCGWSRNSTMPTRYTHIAGVDGEDAVLEIHGIKKKPTTTLMPSKFCPRCDEENGHEKIYCGKCGTNLDIPVSQLAEDKKVQKQIAEMQEEIDFLKSEPRFDG